MRESVKAIVTVVVTDAGGSNASERHRLHKQMDIHLIDRSAAKGQAREEMIDSLLVTAEEEAGKRFWALLHLKNGRIDVLVRFAKTWDANLAVQGFAEAFTDKSIRAWSAPVERIPLARVRSLPSPSNRSKGASTMETTILNAIEYRNVSLSLLNESKTNPRRIFVDAALKERRM